MKEFIKAGCSFFIIVGLFFGIVAWFLWSPDRVAGLVWSFRIIGPTLVLLGLGLFIWIEYFRRDRAVDYLRKYFGNYYRRNGFCAAFGRIAMIDGHACLELFFQNQYLGASIANVALRPVRSSFRFQPSFEPIRVQIHCAPAAFGMARIPLGIPASFSGMKVSLELGVSVQYVHEKGSRARHHEGIFFSTDAQFGNARGVAFAMLGALAGQIAAPHRAQETLELPNKVDDSESAFSQAEVTTLWKWGDPPLRSREPNDNNLASRDQAVKPPARLNQSIPT